jgi:hypothetical protein
MNNSRRIQRHLVKVLAAGALLGAAALPMAIATAAGAAPVPSGVTFSSPGTGDAFGSGASGTVSIAGGGFAANGGNVTVTSNAPGLTFSGVTESTDILAGGSYASTSATVPGTYSISVTDSGGTDTLANAIVVNADPSFTSVSPAALVDLVTPTATTVTVTGAGFVSGDTVTFTNVANGTTLASAGTTFTGDKLTTGQGTSTFGTSTSLTVFVAPTNSVTGRAATIGAYTVTVTNPDGGSVTSGSVFTISGNEISEVTPSAVAEAAGTTPITVTGSGFGSNATLALGTCPGVTLGTAAVGGATTITDSLIIVSSVSTTPFQCDLTVSNGAPDYATYLLTGAIGIGEASAVAPTITASSLSTAAAVLPGAPAQAITFTGTGFSQYTAPVKTETGTAGTPDTFALIGTSCLGGQSGTTLTCELTVSSGAITGVHAADIGGTVFPAAFSVAGPTITSAAPVALAVGAPVGTVVALTGTGFGPTTTGSSNSVTGVFQNVSATQENFVVTLSPSAPVTDTITVSSADSYGASSSSAPLTLLVEAAPSVSSTTYVTGTTGVGVGSMGQTVTVNGLHFATGATIGHFVNAAGVADPDVTGTVTSVNAAGTQLTATIAVLTGDANAIDGFTITNTDGGTTTATAAAPAGLVLEAAPTITAISPVIAIAATTNAFTITGTGFQTGAKVILSSDGTCGTATVASATSITVSCTIGEPNTVAVTLSVVNPDGGTATSGTILAAKAAVAAFHVTNPAHGTAIAGRTSTLTISGTGFYGQPKVTSTASGTKAVVSHDTGKLLTVVVTTKMGVAGEHTFTVTEPNGKSGKANYSIKK